MKIAVTTIVAIFSLLDLAPACIWDSKTLADEKKKDPSLAEAILSPTVEKPETKSLTERIQRLRNAPHENDPAWWNDLAGAYLRLRQPEEAVKILEPITNKFDGDYGVHANLGTAYHLLGRYQDAEQEIARDLEINPLAHFDLEKYHLALLQYLIRDEAYRLRHVYVDEFTISFFTEEGYRAGERDDGFYREIAEPMQDAERKKEAEDLEKSLRERKTLTKAELYEFGKRICNLVVLDIRPKYRSQWNLAKDPNLEKGAIYMAGLNGREPACWVMLGILAMTHSDKNLTMKAFEKAIELRSPQAAILQAEIDELRRHISMAQKVHSDFTIVLVAGFGLIVVFLLICRAVIKRILPRSH